MSSTSVHTWPPGLWTLHSAGQYNSSSTCVWPDCAPTCEVLFSWIFGPWTWGFIRVKLEGKISLDCLKPCAAYNQKRERRRWQPCRLHVSPSRDAEPKLWAPAWYLELICARGYLSRLFRIVATSCRGQDPWISILRQVVFCLSDWHLLLQQRLLWAGVWTSGFSEWWVTPWYHYLYHPLLFRVSTTHLSGTLEVLSL